ncbi:hypothetical protein [Gordonia phthalatica]|uniref:Uncharacterized protein n=1 Tax=Gordonia phthalatica TaxID=1136941 RepID=A0A0N9NJ63_9ACTN|nr:hypothetical protein [Gordonia phthalatica]ALG85645.1 hypothetical protein ACH46_15610 [Gordonia phthalatica]
MLDRLEKWGRIAALVLSPIGLVFSAIGAQWLQAFGFAVLLLAVGIGFWSRSRQAAEAEASDDVVWSADRVREVVDGAESRTAGIRRLRVTDRSLSLLDAVKLYDGAVVDR